ncbi:hypothetical protein HII36_40630 [Nonomuraea sp. NN258]|nr:hypothetical protein [Nonomuraea antri]NRQ38093.1 hypothetical protein [Nonomuraea antri]
MRALFTRLRRTAPLASDVTFDETAAQVCDTACRASAAVERARTFSLSYR